GVCRLQVSRDAREGSVRAADAASCACWQQAWAVRPERRSVSIGRQPPSRPRGRAAGAARALANVSFREGDPVDMAFEPPFDAVVGRYVLMFQADACIMLRGLARHLRPGGGVGFPRPDW